MNKEWIRSRKDPSYIIKFYPQKGMGTIDKITRGWYEWSVFIQPPPSDPWLIGKPTFEGHASTLGEAMDEVDNSFGMVEGYE